MNTEQLRAEFEAWLVVSFPGIRIERLEDQRYVSLEAHFMFEADRKRQGDAAKVLAELVALIPLADTLNASASCQDLIDYFKGVIADRKRSLLWDYCPECGNTEYTSHVGCGNFCTNCGQEWHSDIDYSEAVQKNLSDRQRRGEPIQPSEIVATEAPLGAIENGRAFADRLENDYSFECQGGPLHNCSDWQEFRRCFEHLAEWALSQAPQLTEPVGEVVRDTYGGYSHIKWKTGYKAGVGDKLYLAPQPAEPSGGEPVAGYTMVPVEPTPQMIAAFRSGFQNELHKNDRRRTMSAEEAGLRAMLKATPQPAEPARVPSDDLQTLQMMRAEYDPGNGPMSTLKAAALDAAIAALLARYGQPAVQSDAEIAKTCRAMGANSFAEFFGKTASQPAEPVKEQP